MASNASIFFAGVGTTFLILGAGFGSGLLMANTALKEPSGYQAKAREDVPAPVRVILPSSAQAAEAKPVVQPAAPTPQVQAPVKDAQAAPEQVERSDKKADADKRRKRTVERKARRLAARRNHQYGSRPTEQAPVLAFGNDEPRTGTVASNFNFNGN